jgi:hypothetical protein
MPFFLSHITLQKETTAGNMAADGEAEKATQVEVTTPAKRQIKWGNVIVLTVIHLLAAYGFLAVIPRSKLASLIWSKWN